MDRKAACESALVLLLSAGILILALELCRLLPANDEPADDDLSIYLWNW